MKAATAPIFGSEARRRATSAPASKSSRCTRTGTSAPGYRWEKSNFGALVHWRGVLRHRLVYCSAYALDFGKRGRPWFTARDEPGAQMGHRRDARRHIHDLAFAVQRFAQAGEVQHGEFHRLTAATRKTASTARCRRA